MKLTVDNNSGQAVTLNGWGATIADGSDSVEFSNIFDFSRIDQTVADLAGIDGCVCKLDLEGKSCVRRIMMDETDAPAGGASTATVGFKAYYDTTKKVQIIGQYSLRAFVSSDTDGLLLDTDAILGTATSGSFTSGEDSQDAKIQSDTDGEFACTETDTTDEQTYFHSMDLPSEPDCINNDYEGVEFTAA